MNYGVIIKNTEIRTGQNGGFTRHKPPAQTNYLGTNPSALLI